MLRLPASRGALGSSSLLTAASRRSVTPSQRALNAAQARQQHAVSNPTLANIEKRWEQMPPQEQAELWMALRDRMTVDWNQLTLQEKKASYWIAFGPHGPRSVPKPEEKWEILRLVALCLGGSAVVFGALRYFAGPAPKTMTKEWQEASNEYLKNQRSEAITGVSSEGYEGPGMVQSAPGGAKSDE